MKDQMDELTNQAHLFIAEMIGLVGASHILSKYLMDMKAAVEAMEREYGELWELLEGQTKPKEEKEEFQEVEK